MKSYVKKITVTAAIAALYAVLTIAFAPISFPAVQFRVSEALTILPLFFPEAIFGLTIGCFIANIFGNGVIDMVFGTLASFIAAVLTFFAGRSRKTALKLSLGLVPPVLVNALVVPFTFLAATELKEAYWISALQVGFGQLVVVCVLGIPLYFAVRRLIKSRAITV